MGKIIENNVLRFEYDTGSSEDIGKIQIRKGTDWVPSISKILMRMGRKPLQILTYSDVKKTDNFHKMTITMANHMEFILKFEENSPALFIIPKSHQTIRNVNLTLEITINFHGSNQYDYINLSGLKYQKVKNPKKF